MEIPADGSRQDPALFEGLVLQPAIGRSEGGYRLFAEEIQGCQAVHDAGDLPCGDIHMQLERQIERIDIQIRELGQLRQELQSLLARRRASGRPARLITWKGLVCRWKG